VKIDRLLSIIVILLNRERITAKELSSRFEVSVRTIYRDIDTINMAGIPIIALQGNDGGFSIMENFTLKRHLFSFEDMMGVISALKGINIAIGDKTIDSTIEKFRNMIPGKAKDDALFSAEEIIMDIMPWGARRDIQPIFKKIYGAIRERLCVELSYTGNDCKPTVRIVEPMSLVFKGYKWYLYGYCRLRSGYRMFKLARISLCTITADSFILKSEGYKTASELSSEKNLVLVVLRFSAALRERFEDYFPDESFSDEGNGMLILKSNMPDEPWLVNMVMTFEDDVEVVSPASLRKKVAERAEKIARKYQG
jgi:predicted DNA-binding transcriptional regulator YafY